jgi:hypothetical protein
MNSDKNTVRLLSTARVRVRVNKGRILALVIALAVVTGTVAYTTQPAVSQSVTPLFSVEEIISDQDHPYREWLYKLQGRVPMNGYASASVWSLRTKAGTALIVSALHTLGEGYLGPGGSLIEERLGDPDEKPGATRIYLVKEDGSVDSLASVLFILYNPEVPSEQSGNNLRDIYPRHDFFVGVIDSQKVVMEPLPGTPGPLKNESPVIFDPSDLTTVAPTAADVTPGDSVLLMGYPREGDFAGMLAANIGRVLSDVEAEAAIEELAALGDEEGGIAYDPEAEMIIEGYSIVGMSGGGVFDRAGSLVGILERASYEYNGKQYVRVVRMTYVVARINSVFEALSDSERAVVSPYLEAMPMPTPTPNPAEPMPMPTPTPTPEPGGIPGFPGESLLAGLAVVILVLWFRQRTN